METALKIEHLNKYFGISRMPQVGSTYWNMVHGHCAEDVRQDAEGLQTMRHLAGQMAWLLKCIQAGKDAGIAPPALEPIVRTNFVR